MRLCLEEKVVTPARPHRKHLSCSDDLVTPYEAVRAGFVSLALEKNRRATPFVEQARALKASASKVTKPASLKKIADIQPALLIAAGVSEKAATHMLPEDKAEAIQGLIRNFLEPAGKAFVEELVFRWLLTRGDALGGSMRNIGGVLAQRKFARAMISTLTLAGIPYYWLHATTNTWAKMSNEDADIELHLRGLSWSNRRRSRTVIFNLTVPLTRNNVDFCLFNCNHQKISPAIYKLPKLYIALGELKGGIDPAGADEHWKTANTALRRLRSAFQDESLSPQTFFVGAAIQKKMASEMWNQLGDGTLNNAANLTDENQLASICHWLCNL
ncbi:MAG: restriction endonuclease [Chloroflexi bacterium CG07_land_8_20_14_0_80_51_10]|nr:MAG: restriction endonuclease [Chloroflexi bacterium CG07_land_8_20_14_0_80_51_10]